MRRARWMAGALACLGWVATTTPAWAEPDPWRPGGSEGSSDPDAPHSRFMASVGLGGGWFRATSGTSDDTRTFHGGVGAGHFALGSRISRYLSLGGGYWRSHVFHLTAKDEVLDGDEPDLDDVRFGLNQIAFFLDVYACPDGGFRAELLAGLGWLHVSRGADDPSGVMWGLGAGYDVRVNPAVLLGGMLGVTYGDLAVNENNGTDVSVFVPTLKLVATLGQVPQP